MVWSCLPGPPSGDVWSNVISETFTINIIDECTTTTFDSQVINFADIVFAQDTELSVALAPFTHSAGNKYGDQAICGSISVQLEATTQSFMKYDSVKNSLEYSQND